MNVKQTADEILVILDEAIDNYISSKFASYWAFLNSRGLYRQRINYYLHEKPNKKIIEKMDILRTLQEDKLVEGLLSRGSEIKDVGAIFILKTSHGFIERDKKEANEIAREKLKQEKELDGVGKSLNINFTIAEHRSEEDIQKLIDDSQV